MDTKRLDALRSSAALETALELFGEHGYDGASTTAMQSIARRTGIGRATLYRLFGNHVGLYRAVVTLAAERFAGIVAAAREASALCEAPSERTQTFLLRLLNGIREQRAVWCTLTDRARNAEASATLTDVQGRLRTAVIDGALADSRSGRALTDQQAEWAARFIYGGLAEILRLHLPEASAADDRALVSFLAAAVPGWPASSR